MAQLEINKETFNFNSNTYLNLKSLIPKVQKMYSNDTNQMAFLKVNGISIDVNSEDPSLVRPINDSDYIQIQFNGEKSGLKEVISDINTLITSISTKIMAITKTLEGPAVKSDQQQLELIVDAVNIFVQAITYALKNVTDKQELIDTLPIRELKIHLLSVMKAIETAHNSEDYIMLSDLLEYELKDNLTKWKILVMPTISQQLRKES
jgi:hypothetical protein